MKLFFYILIVVFFFSCTKEKKDVSFTRIETGTKYRINDIYFLDKNKGFAVGGDRYFEGNIIKTLDGGTTWQKLDTSSMHSTNGVDLQTLYSVDFFNDSIGEAVGYGGKIIRTEDGGNNWHTILHGTWSNFLKVKMISPTNSFIVSSGSLFYSPQYWYYFNIQESSYTLSDIEFTDNNNAYLSGQGFVKKSVDNGVTWKTLDIKGDYFFDIDFVNNNVGYICGWQGGIYKTIDAGETWKIINNTNKAFSTRHHYENIDFLDEKTGVVCAYNGEILFTDNGGDSWIELKTDKNINFHSIYFYDASTVYAGTNQGQIFKIIL